MDKAEPVEGELLAPTARVRRTVVVVDLVESVRLMLEHGDVAIDQWRQIVRQVRSELLERHRGHLVKSLGDGFLLTFERVRPALAFIAELHQLFARVNDQRSLPEVMRIRVGIHLADLVYDDIDVYGSGVNIASRLIDLAGPDETMASAEVVDEMVADIDAAIEDLGECYLKHVAEPMRMYRLTMPGGPPASASAGAADVRRLALTHRLVPGSPS